MLERTCEFVALAQRGCTHQWALIEGFSETGVSLMQLDVGMDTGTWRSAYIRDEVVR